MMKRDSMVFYRSFMEATDSLDPETYKITLQSLLHYAMDGKQPKSKGIAHSLFALMKPQIDANNRRYENGKKGAEFGKLGGRPRKEARQEPHSNPKKTPNINDNVNLNLNDKKIFIPPSVDEVKTYCSERNNSVDAEAFVSFYESKGWVIGKSKMKDWKAAVRTWERNCNQKGSVKNADQTSEYGKVSL